MMRLVLIGLPTAGKSTLSHRIAVATDVPQVNVGHCLRTAAANDAALGETLARGGHVDDGIAADAVRAGLADASGYVLDGYPRSTAQLAVFDGWPAARDCRFVLLDLEPDIVRRRFLARMNCAACRRADYGSGLPRTCRECGRPLTPRSDATEDALAAKLAAFRAHEEPLVRQLERDGRLLRIAVTGNADDDFTTLMQTLGAVAGDVQGDSNSRRPALR
jgi:adenylate kinase